MYQSLVELQVYRDAEKFSDLFVFIPFIFHQRFNRLVMATASHIQYLCTSPTHKPLHSSERSENNADIIIIIWSRQLSSVLYR